MGVSSNGGIEPLIHKLKPGYFSGAYIVGEDLVAVDDDPDEVRQALRKLSFLVVQDIRMSETAKLAHVVLPPLISEKRREPTPIAKDECRN